MKVEFTGRHVEVSPAIKKHAQEHLEKLEKVFDFDNGKAHVILEVEKHRHRAEILFRWRDQEIAVKAETDDMYTSVTQAADKLERQALKLKEKKTNLKRQSQAREVVKPLEDNLTEEVESNEAKIIRSSRYAAKPLTPEEAMHEVKGSENQFLVFRDAKTERISVIYKRNDGNFGLIEP